MPRKNAGNRFNLKNGLAFAYRMGDMLENTVSCAIANSPMEAPVLRGEPEASTWYRVPVAEGIAGDGSDYYIYVSHGTCRHLCVFFSGGGVAWNEYTAARPVTGGKLTAGMPNYYWNNLRPFTQLMNIRTGITDLSNPLNPFRNWNFVIVTYATGDFHVGNSDFFFTSEEGRQKVVHFRGHRNFEAAMKRAVKLFPNPDKLLIAGDSAGAFAVPALTDEILQNSYPACRDVTLLSDSGLLLYHHWKRTARDIWKASPSIWKPIRSDNLTMDWYRNLYARYGERLRYLYASSTRDYLLSAYYNDVVSKSYRTDEDVQEAYFGQLREMLKDFKAMAPHAGFFINDFRNLAVYPGLRGGTVHTAVRQLSFYLRTKSGETMAQWLANAVEGDVRSEGLEYLK
ncbi:MAG: pectinacetylesterase family protein [Lachnospiraceae bacterium]|jgi:hypothetical protein|nr:pectinacetylesterase family protein [Lachnospiraceae bacterium]